MIPYNLYKQNLKHINKDACCDISFLKQYKNFLNTNRSGHRYYLSIPSEYKEKYKLPKQISNAIKEYLSINKIDGKVSKDYVSIGNRKIRIGKFLFKVMKNDELYILYNDSRSSFNSLDGKKIVISNHPYDIMGASTNRNWTSCIDLYDKKYDGKYIYQLSFIIYPIIYIIDENDDNIKKPYSRYSESTYQSCVKGIEYEKINILINKIYNDLSSNIIQKFYSYN